MDRALREAGDGRTSRVSARASFWVSRRRPSPPPLSEPSLRPLFRLASLVLALPIEMGKRRTGRLGSKRVV